MTFTVYKTDKGEFRWRLFDDDGARVTIKAGTAPGIGDKKADAAARRAIQAALKARYERQQSLAS